MGKMVKNMNGLKKFKVFYFLADEQRRKLEIIMARNEDEAEDIFKLMYNKGLSDGTISFGWAEEAVH